MCNKCGIRPRTTYKNNHNTWCKKCTRDYARDREIQIKEGKWNPNKKKKVRNIKRIHVVYAYFDTDGNCIYVGRGSINRAKSHRFASSWWNSTLLLVTMTCKNEWEVMEYEGKWGGKYLPTMNKEGYRY